MGVCQGKAPLVQKRSGWEEKNNRARAAFEKFSYSHRKEYVQWLAEAKREVDRLLAEAREQAVREASQTEIVKIAERQADEIVDDARRSSREMKLEMEDWADNQLASLEVNLERFLTAVKRGRDRLHERSQETVIAGLSANGDVADDERF